jgi:arylsulfatase A-like enzyme
MIARWPAQIPAGASCDHLARTIDIFPTIANIVGGKIPSNRRIDGRDLRESFAGGDSSDDQITTYYYWNRELHAVRDGRWKLHFPHKYSRPDPAGNDGKPGTMVTREIQLALFDLEHDPGETTDISNSNPDVVARLQSLAEQAREDLGDSLTARAGKNVRPAGTAEW